MQFANTEGGRVEATPKARGSCPACGAEMIAKCGTQKIRHWAHKGRKHCDHWWENETEWHRDWKKQFPKDWSEVVQTSSSGEKHIADVRTEAGVVIEFQHSPISFIERQSREDFYADMVWVVDGARLKTDYSTFFDHVAFHRTEFVDGLETRKINPHVPRITKKWMGGAKPLYLDFGGDELWSISEDRGTWYRFATTIQKSDFVSALTAGIPPRSVPRPQ